MPTADEILKYLAEQEKKLQAGRSYPAQASPQAAALDPRAKQILDYLSQKASELEQKDRRAAQELRELGLPESLAPLRTDAPLHYGLLTGLARAGRSFTAGIGDLLQTAGGAAQWAGLEGAGRSLEEAGSSISERYGVEAPPFTWRSLLDPRFWTTTVARTLPTTLALIPAAIAGGYLGAAGATALRLGAWGRTILGAIGAGAASRPLESALEAGSTYQEALARGMTEEEADRAADQVFRRNLALSGLDAAQWAAAFAPVPPAVRRFTARLGSQALGRTAVAAGRVVGAGLPEAGEEYLQEGIQRSALGEPQPWRLDPQAQQALALGGIFGAGMGGAGEVYTSLRDATVRRLAPDLQQRFEAEKQRFQQSGMAEQQAEVAALDAVAADPRGAVASAHAARDVARQLQQQPAQAVAQPGPEGGEPAPQGPPVNLPREQVFPQVPVPEQLQQPAQAAPAPAIEVETPVPKVQQPQAPRPAPVPAPGQPEAAPSPQQEAAFAEGDRVTWTDKRGRSLQGEIHRIKGNRIWVRITQSSEGGPKPGMVVPVSQTNLVHLERQDRGQVGEAAASTAQQPAEGIRRAPALEAPSGADAPALPMEPVETPVEAQPLEPPTTRATETEPAGQVSVEQPPQAESPFLRQLRRTGAAYRADTGTAAKVVAHPADENAFTVEVERDGNRTYPLVDQRLTLEQAQQAAARILEEAAPAEEASPTAGESVGVPVTAPAQPATQTLGAAPVSPDDVDFQLAVDAHRWNSMNPEERARGIQQEYVQHMRSVWRELSNLAKSPEQQRVAQAEFERYKEQYLAHLRAVLEARSRTASAMVTGPSKFPTKRNQQALEREYRRIQEMQQWERRALAAMRRAVHEARTPAQAADAEWRRLERDILDNIATIRLIDQGDPSQRGMDRSAFVRSIEGRIRRIAASGKVDLAQRALDLVRKAQANMSKPVFTQRHSIWQVAEKAQARAAARPAPAGQEEIATFEGARVVANREVRRTQILFDAKPSEAVRQALRREGWVWSPRNQAWQRPLTANSEESARRILSQHFEPVAAGKPSPAGPAGTETSPPQHPEARAAAPPAPDQPAPQRLEEIRQRVDNVLRDYSASMAGVIARRDIPYLIAEVERLRTANPAASTLSDDEFETIKNRSDQGKNDEEARPLWMWQVREDAPKLIAEIERLRSTPSATPAQPEPVSQPPGTSEPANIVERLRQRYLDTVQREGESKQAQAFRQMADDLEAGRPIRDPMPVRVDPGTRLVWHSAGANAPAAVLEVADQEPTLRYMNVRVVERLHGADTDAYFQSRFDASQSLDGGRFSLSVADWKHLRLPGKEAHSGPQLPLLQPVATGYRAQAFTERGTGVETEYAVVEADQLIASHDTALRPNPSYPAELQPRERSRVASELQVQRIVQQLQPEFLGESPKASEGAPIVGPDAVVESGNGRVIAIKRIYEQNHPNAARYREWLAANAGRFGIDPEAVRQAKAPVLVRIRRSDVDRLQFVREANEQAVAAMSATEQAMSDARMLTPEMVALFEPGDEGQIVTPANRDFVSLFMQQVVGPAERGRYMTAEGSLSQEGVNRIRNAIFARAYGDPDVLAKLAEDPDNNVRNITQAMLIAAPRMVELKAGVEQGRLYTLDLSADLAAAVKKLSSLREQGQTVEMYLQQGALFDDGLSPVAKDLLGVLEKYKRSRTKLAAILTTYAELAKAAGNPNQASLFEEVRPPAKADVLDAAIERVESGGYVGGGALQAALFEAQPAHVSIPEPPAGQEAQAGSPGAADPGAAQESPQAPLREVEARLRQQAQAAHEERERRQPEQLGAGVGFPPLSARADDAPHSPYAFSDPEVEARWQAAKGVKQPPFTERVRQWWEKFARQATREFEFLPRTAEFAEMRQALLRLRAQKDVTSDRTIRLIDGIVAPLDAQGYDLFSRRVVLDDLRHEAAAGRPLPFGFEPVTLQQEAGRIDQAVEANPAVRQAVEQRRQMWEAVKREYIEAMEAIGFNVRDRLTREDYFRHQVLEYANLKGISGSGRKLRTPSGRGFLRRREGSSLDINSDYLQAEYEVLAQMLMDIEIARAIRTVDEHYNIRNRLQREAAAANLQAIQRKALQGGDTALVDRLTDFRRRIAIGLDRLRKKAASNDLWRGESGEWEDLVERLEEEHLDIVEALQEDLPFEGGSTAPPETPLPPEVRPLFRFLAELAKRDVEGSQEARMIFKAISERRQWIRDTLGDQYLTWRDLIPEGYTTWQPREGNIFFITDSIPANIANRLLEQGLEQIGISQEDIRRVLAMGGPRREFVVRDEIASTLDNLTKPREDSVLHQAGRTLTRGWKVLTLFSPFRFLRYEFRNLTGDLDAVLAGSPSALRKLPQAVRDLAKVFVEHKEMPSEMREWFERGGMHSLLRVQELGDLNRLEQFERLMRRKQNLSEQTVGRMWRGYWRAVNLTNDFREAILRYAAYLDYLDQIQRNRGRPDNFGASIPDEIMALSDIRDRAYRLSNELLGAYDQVSVFGQQLREYAFPFWSWVEVNNRRYIQLIKNAVQDGKVAELVGRKLVGTAVRSPFLLMRVGRLALGALALSALMEVWNRTFFPDEEEDLPEDVRAKPHLVFGRNADGSVRYIGQLGALNDFLDWFGLAGARQHISDYLQGRRTLKEIAADMVSSPANKLVQGFGLSRTAFELIVGLDLYPDIRRPGRIRDRGLHLADSVGLGDLYRKARGYPVRPGRPFNTALFTLAHPGESAYYYIRDEVSRYMRQLGKATGGYSESERSNALYWLKVALRYGDTEAANRWLEEYVLLGGTRQGLEQSLRSLHPLYGLNEQEQQAFVAQLPFEDLGRLFEALAWYEQVVAATQALPLQALPSSRQGSGASRPAGTAGVKVPSVKAPSVQAPRPLVKP